VLQQVLGKDIFILLAAGGEVLRFQAGVKKVSERKVEEKILGLFPPLPFSFCRLPRRLEVVAS
jgi:hypothetical protein